MRYLLKTEVPIDITWKQAYKLFKSDHGDGGWWRNKTLPEGKNLRSDKSMITYHC